jgi:hypothetical protein
MATMVNREWFYVDSWNDVLQGTVVEQNYETAQARILVDGCIYVTMADNLFRTQEAAQSEVERRKASE